MFAVIDGSAGRTFPIADAYSFHGDGEWRGASPQSIRKSRRVAQAASCRAASGNNDRLSILWREVISLASCRAPRRLSRVVTTTLLSEVAEIVALPDLRSEVPEDRVRDRDVEEEVAQHQVPDVVVATEPPAYDRRRQFVCVGTARRRSRPAARFAGRRVSRQGAPSTAGTSLGCCRVLGSTLH